MHFEHSIYTYTGNFRIGLSFGKFGLLLTSISRAGYFLVVRDGDFICKREEIFRIILRFVGISSAPSSCEIFGRSQLNPETKLFNANPSKYQYIRFETDTNLISFGLSTSFSTQPIMLIEKTLNKSSSESFSPNDSFNLSLSLFCESD